MSTAARRVSIGVYCAVDDQFGPEVHARCRGNGPLYLPGTHAPVLPAEACGCPCHTAPKPASDPTSTAQEEAHHP